ncbi:MAG TPA: dihydropteroate synthase, partial [Gemmataceae bacterium]|nr:dihydropteroate synthase [Gemmataceae bacterium]
LPVVAELAKQTQTPLSIDTSKAEVARRCLDAGAAIVNDVSGLQDPEMVRDCAEAGAGVVVMHMQGDPRTMQLDPQYDDVVGDELAFFESRLRDLGESGIDPSTVSIDPGIGFGKTREHNLQLLANLGAFGRFGRPLCLGVSRKGFIDRVCGRALADRMPGSLAVNCFAAARGEAHILRVHDVGPTRDAALLLDAIDRYRR